MTIHDANNPFAPMHLRRPKPQRKLPPLPAPEDVFAHWLRCVPPGANLEAAARAQIALIDRRAPLHPHAACLRTLLAAVAGDRSLRKPTMNA